MVKPDLFAVPAVNSPTICFTIKRIPNLLFFDSFDKFGEKLIEHILLNKNPTCAKTDFSLVQKRGPKKPYNLQIQLNKKT